MDTMALEQKKEYDAERVRDEADGTGQQKGCGGLWEKAE